MRCEGPFRFELNGAPKLRFVGGVCGGMVRFLSTTLATICRSIPFRFGVTLTWPSALSARSRRLIEKCFASRSR